MNRQVPTHYLIIGNGRLARHLSHYFEIEGIPYLNWSRKDSLEDLKHLQSFAKKILIAIKDDAIESFIQENQLPLDQVIHFSGSLELPGISKLHPLMSFSTELYTLEEYRQIPFIHEQWSPSLRQQIPELKNPCFEIPPGSSAKYHALCVLAGNGTVVFWQSLLKAFQNELSLPQEVLHPYLQRILKNFLENPDTALTGPWVRNDLKTIEKNKLALTSSSHAALYSLFAQSAQSSQRSTL